MIQSDAPKDHWERIYSSKKSNEVSWTQDRPATSLDFLHSFNIGKDSAIIDIGGGESKLVDFLLDEGFTDLTVVDISENALLRVKERLGERAEKVHWIVADVTRFIPPKKYDVWHDRATFHFLITQDQITKYIGLASSFITSNGFMTVGTFSEKGPSRCSGLEVKRYSEESLSEILKKQFVKIRCVTEDHETPFHTFQNFVFCSFRRKSGSIL